MKKHSFLHSFVYAFQGIKDSLKSEYNFRFHVLAACVAIVLGFILDISVGEWFCITLVISLVFAAELLNTAVESLANAVSLAPNRQIKKAKDAAAAAVLVLSVFALLCGAYIYLPKIFGAEL